MRRIVSLWLPRLPTDRLRRDRPGDAPVDRPLVMVATVQGRPVLAAVDARAAALGLAPGLALADARARLDDLVALPADPAADAQALDRLAAAMERYTPLIGLDGADGLWLDITGADHLHGDEARLLDDLLTRTTRAGYVARAGLADTPGAAWALARYGTPVSTAPSRAPSSTAAPFADAARPSGPVFSPPVASPPGGQRMLLAALPIPALRLDVVTVETLSRLGLRRVGDLIDQPRAPLVQRFGPALAERLDQALGRIDEPIRPRRPPPPFHERLQPAEPLVQPDDIARALRLLLARLADRLARARRGARRLELACHRVDGEVRRLAIGTSRPVRDPLRLARLFAEPLETLDPGFGIELFALAAREVEPLAPGQLALAPETTGESPSGDVTADLIDRLAQRLGATNVRRLTPRASHLPERATRFQAAIRMRADRAGGARGGTDRTAVPLAAWRRGRWRPPRLLPRPEPIEAMALLPDHPPARFRWRGRLWLIARAEGPERIAPEWWRHEDGQGELWLRPAATAEARGSDAPAVDAGAVDAAGLDAATRDYYRVETVEGRRFWLFRRGLAETRPHDAPATAPAWYLHAIAP